MAARNDLARRRRVREQRRNKGQAVTVLMIFLAAFVVAPLCLVAYEMCLYNFSKQQLKACLDSAALAAGATVATSDNLDTSGTQVGAKATALNMFKQNTILSYSMASATESSSPTMNPGPGQAMLYFQFLDPVSRQAVPLGSANGKIIQVSGAFGYTPLFAKFLNLPTTVTAYEMSNGGLPMLDVVLCFDISASMDDFSLVTIVNRYSKSVTTNGVTKKIAGYNVLNKGALYNAFKCTSPTGTPLNSTFPQELDGGGGAYSFSASARGVNCGVAPLNSMSSTAFTDLVVNVDGTSDMSQGCTINGCTFPANNIGLLVEASRGNFESIVTATTAGIDYSTWGVTPKAGYFAAYQQAAMAQRHPISDAIIAAQNFFTIMNNDCDAHFSLVSFGSDPGTTAKQVVNPDYATLGNITDNPSSYVSNLYPTDPMVPLPPNPGVMLNPTIAAGTAYSNYTAVMSAVQTLVAYGGTNISGALSTALNEFKATSSGGQGLSRPGAKKAIVLFTDGLPTATSFGGDPTADARAQAVLANSAGIPIYCIGLCLVPSLQANQTAVLNDTNSNSTTGGIAGISGNNAQFYQATDTSQLNQVFENVARALVNLIR
ncbi:MAG TPA: vWA domain-containing protein [Drouetiella sp.]